MKIIGVDFGLARTGVAIWDDDAKIVLPLIVIDETDLKETAQKLADLAFNEAVDLIVVGHPRAKNGEEGGMQAEATARFMQALDRRTRLPVVVEDERMSSGLADRLRRSAGKDSGVAARDALAAAAILETYVTRKSLDKPPLSGISAEGSEPENGHDRNGQDQHPFPENL